MSTLSVIQAAETLKIHPKTVLELINSGAIPAAKIGRAYVMIEKDVLKYLENQVIRQTSMRLREGCPQRRRMIRAS